MKKTFILALAAACCMSVNAAKPKKADAADKNKPVFTVVKQNPTTSVKDQAKSGTCWNYSTLSYFESEILKKTGKTYDLCEMFVCNHDYMDRAIMKVRMHGDAQFSEGGSNADVLDVIREYGICPEEAMPAPGSLYGDTLNNFKEFFTVMSPYVDALAKSDAKKISTYTWRNGLQGILDAYLGKCPESFTYEGKNYTPKAFAASLGLDWNDYVSITSYTHHPFYTQFPVEVQDNWRQAPSWNLPMDEMARIIDNAVMNGYTVSWGGDVSEDGFTRDGLALLIDNEDVALIGSDMAKWLKLSKKEKQDKIKELGVNVKELTPSQQERQKEYDNWQLTDDHGMLIFGIAKDQTGREYYMVKNSWGKYGDYDGIWYMSKNFIVAKTMDYMVNKNAIPADIRKKMGI